MGGTPTSALSIVCYPQKGRLDILGRIMLGGQQALNEENVVVLGGHSVDDQEIKFGYAVIISEQGIKNSGGEAEDVS